jgi:RHS repeat-associated protein
MACCLAIDSHPYNDAGELATVDRYQDGVLAVEGDYTYDSAGDLTGLVYRQGDTVLASYAWTYSGGVATLSAGSSNADWLPSGGIVPVHDTTGVTSALMSGGFAGLNEVTSCTSVDGTANYSYDPTGELLAATYSGGQASESYSYDANGNRIGYVIGADNRLLSDGTYTYSYDAEGNRTAKFIDTNHDGVLDAGDTDVTEFTWDNRDRLTEVKTYAIEGGDPTEVVDYLYDVENRWIGENIFNGTEHQIRFAYDGNEIVLQFDKDGSGTLHASNLTHRYTWLPGAVDQLMSDEQLQVASSGSGHDLTTAGNVVWTLGDNQGTIRDLAVCQNGVTSVVNHRVFDSFGNLKSALNPSTNQLATVDCLFGFTGLAFDHASGTYRSATRPYDPTTGRWTQPDLIEFNGRDTNLNRYCNNDPINRTDPSGEVVPIIIGAGVFAIWWFFTPNVANAPGPGELTYPADPIPNPAPALAAGATAGAGAAALGSALTARGAIVITEQGMAHVLKRHAATSLAKAASKFLAGEDIAALIRAGAGVLATQQANGNFQRIVDAGRIIGIDRATGQATRFYTIITNAAGELVTTFPGVPKGG